MNDKYEKNKDVAIAALVLGKSYAQAAKAAGVDARTLYEWRKREDFQADYRGARRRVVEDAYARAQAVMTKAVEKLNKLIDSENEQVALSAARAVLAFGAEGTEKADLLEAFEQMKKAFDEREKDELTGQIPKIRRIK